LEAELLIVRLMGWLAAWIRLLAAITGLLGYLAGLMVC
jgi:hypothetical protein